MVLYPDVAPFADNRLAAAICFSVTSFIVEHSKPQV